MKIRKFIEFIKEELNDTPESYIEIALKHIKKKIDKMFEDQIDLEEEKEKDGNSSIMKAKANAKDKSKITFRDLGIQLESSEISTYSKICDSLTVKFSDARFAYDMTVLIELKEGMPKDPTKDFSYKDVENCFIKFKKYDKETLELFDTLTKNTKIKDIDEEFLIELKIELDEESGDEDEKLEIETE